MANLAVSIGVAVAVNLVGYGLQQALQPATNLGQVSDIRLTSSTYGVAIPMVWGTARVGANVVWMTDLVQGDNQTGGKGGPRTNNFFYTTSLAIVVCKGPIPTSPGEGVLRIWGEDVLLYDNGQATNATPINSVTWYPGTSTQDVDPTMEANDGAGNVPAYRDVAYIVFDGLNLTPWGGRVPQFSVEVNAGPATVGSILEDVFLLAGLTSDQFNVSQATEPVTGYVSDSRRPAAEVITPLLSFYAVDLAEVDDQVVAIPRGGDIVATIPEDDLGAKEWSASSNTGTSGQDNPTKVETTRQQELDLPYRADVRYYAVQRDYAQGVQSAIRPTKVNTLQQTISLETHLVLQDTEASQGAERALYTAWSERTRGRFSLPPRYLYLSAADPIALPIGCGQTIRVRLEQVDIGLFGEMKCRAVLDDPNALNVAAGTAATTATDASRGIVNVAPTTWYAWSGTELQDTDGTAPGFYCAACGPINWSGCTVYYSPDGGTTWINAGSISTASVIGAAASALGSAGAVAGTFDATNTVSVALDFGSLDSTTEADVLATPPSNAALLGAELLGFQTATQTDNLTYTLSEILRGARGTAMTGHASGDAFVLLNPNAYLRVTVPASLIGETVQVACVSAGQSISDVTPQSIVIATNNLPYTTTAQGDAINATATAAATAAAAAMTFAGTYNAGTTYALNAVVRMADYSALYISLVAGNVGNALTDMSAWALLMGIGGMQG